MGVRCSFQEENNKQKARQMNALVTCPDAADVSTNTGKIVPERDFLVEMYARKKGFNPEKLAETLEYIRTFERRNFLVLSIMTLIVVTIISKMPAWHPELFTAPHGVWVKVLMWVMALVFMTSIYLLSQFKWVDIPKQIESHAFERERKSIRMLLNHVCIDSGLVWLREYLHSAGRDLAPRPYQLEAKDGRDTELSRAIILALIRQRHRMQHQGNLWSTDMTQSESAIFRKGFIAAKAFGLIPEEAVWTCFRTGALTEQGIPHARTNKTAWEELERLWSKQ